MQRQHLKLVFPTILLILGLVLLSVIGADEKTVNPENATNSTIDKVEEKIIDANSTTNSTEKESEVNKSIPNTEPKVTNETSEPKVTNETSEAKVTNKTSETTLVTTTTATTVPVATTTTVKIPKENTETVKPDSGTSSNTFCSVCRCLNGSKSSFLVDCSSLSLTTIPDWEHQLYQYSDVVIDLSNNQLTAVLPFNTANSAIVSLNFDNNRIDSVASDALGSLPRLKWLSLANNKLQSLHHSAFCDENNNPSFLEVINLSGNELHSLDEDLFSCTPSLRHLNISNNDIRQFDSSTKSALNNMRYLSNLKELDLSKNGLSTIPAEFYPFPISSLTILNLDDNEFTQIPDILHKSNKLTHFSISKNPIEILNPSSFVNLTNLISLNISNMPQLRKIYQGTFKPLANLTFFRASGNSKLELIEPMAFNDDSGKHIDIELLDLSYNNITSFMQEIFYNTHVHSLDVRGNPIECTCNIYWIIMEGQVEVDEAILKETFCFSPKEYKGQPVADVMREHHAQLKCSEFTITNVSARTSMSSSYAFLLTMVIIAVFLVIGALVFLIKNQAKKRYKSLGPAGSVQYSKSQDNNGFDSINCDEVEEYSKYPY